MQQQLAYAPAITSAPGSARKGAAGASAYAAPALRSGGKTGAGAVAGAASGQGWLERHERWAPWLLLAVALAIRFYRLDVPAGVVFGALRRWVALASGAGMRVSARVRARCAQPARPPCSRARVPA